MKPEIQWNENTREMLGAARRVLLAARQVDEAKAIDKALNKADNWPKWKILRVLNSYVTVINVPANPPKEKK